MVEHHLPLRLVLNPRLLQRLHLRRHHLFDLKMIILSGVFRFKFFNLPDRTNEGQNNRFNEIKNIKNVDVLNSFIFLSFLV